MGIVGGEQRQIDQLRAELDAQANAAERELRANWVATVRALTNAVEARDAYTGKHAERVAAYGLELARHVDPRLIEDPEVEFGFLLHDVGKVAIPDGILHKPEPLAEPERGMMERHPVIGWKILAGITFLDHARLIVRHHHERWDGAGYPDGLAGEDIPLAARVFSVVDALDAITTDRPYRPGVPLPAARLEIAAGAGTQFDPTVVAALDRVEDSTLERMRAEITW